MIRKPIFLCLLLLGATYMVAQQQLDYKRNSLAQLMIYHPEDEFGPDIFKAWDSLPFPDKFDNHNGQYKYLNNDSISGAQKRKKGLYKAKYGHVVLPKKEVQKNAEAIEQILNQAGLGRILVAKWFNLHGERWQDAVFDCSLIQERGQYNASDVDVEKAMLTARGTAMLADAGEELIGHTFVLVNDMTYVTAEERAQAAKVGLSVIGAIFDGFLGGNTGRAMAQAGGAIADSFTGFKVITNSYLFQLEWNDSIASIFYKQYYTSVPDSSKIVRFWNDNSLFRIKYVAHEHEYAEKTEVKGKYERSELVKMSCTRSIDKNIAALQLAYEDFKVKTPIYSVLSDNRGRTIGYAAKIGMKEGITNQSTFQVVQRIEDPDTHKTRYKYVATVKPVNGKIWDNRYNAVLEGDQGSELSYTTLKKVSGGEILPGMLLIEGKYSKITE